MSVNAAVFGLTSAVVLFAGPLSGLEQARRPTSLSRVWDGLGPSRTSAPTSAVVVLHPPPTGRVRIPGASFVMGSTPEEMAAALRMCAKETYGDVCTESYRTWYPAPIVRAEGHAHEVVVSTFELDRTEVSVGAYAACVARGSCAPPSFPSGDPRYDAPDYPVTHVRWVDARDYCQWAGGRLPTEAEWELAAKGREGRTFPWGNLFNGHIANHGAFANDPTDGSDGFVGLAPIGSFPDGKTPSGLLDMAGNVAEWVEDFYDRDEEGFGYPRGKQVDPKGPPFGPYGHVLRGGSYRDAPFLVRTTARRASTEATREIGFRCAYSIAPTTASPRATGTTNDVAKP